MSTMEQEEDLWGNERCARYFGDCDPEHFRTRIATLPGFPKPVRLPTQTGKRKGHPLYYPHQVRAFAAQCQEKEQPAALPEKKTGRKRHARPDLKIAA